MLLDRGMMGDGVADLKSIRKWVERVTQVTVKLKSSHQNIGGKNPLEMF